MHVWAVGRNPVCSDLAMQKRGFSSEKPRVGGLEQEVANRSSSDFS